MADTNGMHALFQTPDCSGALDPEFARLFGDFAFGEVAEHGSLDGRTRAMAVCACLLGCQGAEAFRAYLPQALGMGLTPVEAKELVYQAVAYLGLGRVFPFFKACNEVLAARGVELPLPAQGTVDPGDRQACREAGTGAQVEIFGEGMREFWNSGSRQTVHLRRWLASWCFGGFYTRKGLTLAERELATFCFIAAQGGCESQLASHAKGNMQVGNGEGYLVEIITQCLPWIGYPRTLNALKCIKDAAKSLACG